MRRGYNIVVVGGEALGVVRRDPGRGGPAVLDMSVRAGDYGGGPVDVPVRVWGRRAEALGQIIAEGDWVDVHGELRQDGARVRVVASDVKVFKRGSHTRVLARVPQDSRDEWEVG